MMLAAVLCSKMGLGWNVACMVFGAQGVVGSECVFNLMRGNHDIVIGRQGDDEAFVAVLADRKSVV